MQPHSKKTEPSGSLVSPCSGAVMARSVGSWWRAISQWDARSGSLVARSRVRTRHESPTSMCMPGVCGFEPSKPSNDERVGKLN